MASKHTMDFVISRNGREEDLIVEYTATPGEYALPSLDHPGANEPGEFDIVGATRKSDGQPVILSIAEIEEFSERIAETHVFEFEGE